MAKRYGGKFSPDAGIGKADAPAPARPRRDPAGARANVMFVPAIPLVFTSLRDGAVELALALTAAALWTLGAWLLRDGLRAEAAYAQRKVARRPAIPRKMMASVLTGLGAAIAAYKTEPGVLAPLLFGLIALALHATAFGIDPLKNKGAEGIDDFQQDRVARVVDEAETLLAEMADAIRRAADRDMENRVAVFQQTARDMIRTVEEDPRDLTAARRYLGVYLLGARDATVKFADIWSRSRDARARADYVALLDDLSDNFASRTRKMLLEDRSDLTVEIEVLRDRLQREGVKP
ncbi:MAG: 5-bromo-4-chloroindolyl phosphate hydrolysis family protein [Rhodobacteraceae bacterium]|nr:5-bromo-4-chloroindolyl phosphate hydrolysis family protein [Paracoccaceae bacterium]